MNVLELLELISRSESPGWCKSRSPRHPMWDVPNLKSGLASSDTSGLRVQLDGEPPAFETDVLHRPDVYWFDHRRLLKPIGDVPPAEYESTHYLGRDESAMAA